MKFSLFLKDTHMKVIEKLKEKHSGTSDQDIVKKYVKAAIQLNDDDLIFGSAREQCGGGCFASEPYFSSVYSYIAPFGDRNWYVPRARCSFDLSEFVFGNNIFL